MSKAMINALLWDINATDEALVAFAEDAPRFVKTWEAAGWDRSKGRRHGGRLTDEEREAFVRFDYGMLYAMGAHPFVLWQTARSLLVPDQMSNEELIAAYREAVMPLGYPDFTT